MSERRIVFTGSHEDGVNECFTVGKEYKATPADDALANFPGAYDVDDDNGETWLMIEILNDFVAI